MTSSTLFLLRDAIKSDAPSTVNLLCETLSILRDLFTFNDTAKDANPSSVMRLCDKSIAVSVVFTRSASKMCNAPSDVMPRPRRTSFFVVVSVLINSTKSSIQEKNKENMKRLKVDTTVCSPLQLHRFIPIKDVRKMIWAYLDDVDREVVRCAHNGFRRPVLPSYTFEDKVIWGGYRNLMLWGHAHGYPFDWESVVRMIEHEQYEMVKSICKRTPSILLHQMHSIVNVIVEYTCLDLLEWLYNMYPSESRIIDRHLFLRVIASSMNSLDILQWALAKCIPLFTSKSFWKRVIERSRYFDVLEFLDRNNLLPKNRKLVISHIVRRYAIREEKHYLECLKWFILERGYPFNTQRILDEIPKASDMGCWIRSFP